MKKTFIILVVVGIVFGGLLGLGLLMGVWLPDVITAKEHTLAKQDLANGYSFRVVQYWNRSDFYNTELRVTSPNGQTKTHLLDWDDSKSWQLPLTIDEHDRTAMIILSGGRAKMVDWK